MLNPFIIDNSIPCHVCNGTGDVCNPNCNIEKLAGSHYCKSCNELWPCPICNGAGVLDLEFSQDIPAVLQ